MKPVKKSPVGAMKTPAESVQDTSRLQPVPPSEDTIRPTDILFNCPHCGHNLCIDCRGAGLLTNCIACAKEIMVPIPDGMKTGDIDMTRDQTLGQLFYTRRLLARAEKKIADLENMIASQKERRSNMEKARLNTLHHCADLVNLCQMLQRNQTESATVLNRMLEIISSEQQH